MTAQLPLPSPHIAPSSASTPAERPWWHGAVIYENHLPTFRDGDGDGIGDLQGLTDSLDYLAETLDVDGIWVGPFFRSPLLDQGFDISDYRDIEPVFGTLDAFGRLVSAAHERGLKIIVDYVPNHTSDQHPWFLESRSSRDNPMRDWYVWADPRPDGSPPNNWVSEAGGSVWEWDERTGQYYLHSHLKEQPDLNWRNPQVRAEMLDVLRFWLDRGADGFRIDVAHMLMKDPELRDNPPSPGAGANQYDVQHPDFHTQLHIHDRLHPDVHGVLKDIRKVLDEYDGRVAIAEIEALDWHEWAAFFGSELDEVHLPFAFRLIETSWRAGSLAEELRRLDEALPRGAWPILALGNHDRPRLATRLGKGQARVAAMMLLTLRGTPCLFYGDELGMRDQPVPAERQRDYFGLVSDGVSRDPIRTPMAWGPEPGGGFSTAPPDEFWLPVSVEKDTVNVATQLADKDSMLNLYRRLTGVRRESAALRHGDWRLLPSEGDSTEPGPGVLTYERWLGNDRKIVALNLSASDCLVRLPAGGAVAVCTDVAREGEPVAGQIVLGPDEGVVVDVPSTDASVREGR
ncbi:alpha-amylase family glycosyl hydrolase [Streptomyces winkii]|uniref:alpha-amylase family glycosyl hydrolase n=1 Tax=Streptomyces winkii TaxID=3051178 RepID=UPI0028D14C5C|nr:alpha-amylase family glycosyl hydrolase [Streptomyces sp. DSM 40971]